LRRINQLWPDCVSSCFENKRLAKRKSGSITSFTAILYISHAFLPHGAASEHQVLLQTGEKQLKENAKFFRLFMEIKPYLKHMSSNDLKDSEWDVRTM
jgi:hypothetical protein